MQCIVPGQIVALDAQHCLISGTLSRIVEQHVMKVSASIDQKIFLQLMVLGLLNSS